MNLISGNGENESRKGQKNHESKGKLVGKGGNKY